MEKLQTVQKVETRSFDLPTEGGSFLADHTERLVLSVEVGHCMFDDEEYDYAIFSSPVIDPSIVSGQFPFAVHETVTNGNVTLYWNYEERPDTQFSDLFDAIEELCKAPAPKDDYSDLYGEGNPFEPTEKQKNCLHQHTETNAHTERGDDSVWTTVELVCLDCQMVIDSNSFGF